MSQGRQNQPIPKHSDNGWAKLGLSCLSAAAAETATYPVDAIKTQLQLQRATKPAGAVKLARQVLKRHGLAGLYAGLSAAVLRHFFYTGQSPQPGSGPSYTVTSPGLRTTHAAHHQQQKCCCMWQHIVSKAHGGKCVSSTPCPLHLQNHIMHFPHLSSSRAGHRTAVFCLCPLHSTVVHVFSLLNNVCCTRMASAQAPASPSMSSSRLLTHHSKQQLRLAAQAVSPQPPMRRGPAHPLHGLGCFSGSLQEQLGSWWPCRLT
jgi:hypothetical protein